MYVSSGHIIYNAYPTFFSVVPLTIRYNMCFIKALGRLTSKKIKEQSSAFIIKTITMEILFKLFKIKEDKGDMTATFYNIFS